jgi:hypothetical protein
MVEGEAMCNVSPSFLLLSSDACPEKADLLFVAFYF